MKNMLEDFINSSQEIRQPLTFTNSDTLEIPSYNFGPEYQRVIRIWTLAIMFVVSLVGNTTVVSQLLPLRRGRFPKSKVMFLNLAAADLFVTFGSMLSQIIWELMDQQWIAGDFFCKFFKFTQTYSLCSSTFMVVAIALDRYSAIVKPFSFAPEPKWYAIGAWTTALIPSLPCFIVFHEVQISDTETKCVSKFYTTPESQMWRQVYLMCVFISVFIIPFVLLSILYIIIVREISTRSSVFSASQQTASSLPKARIKTLRMTNTILCCFLVSSLPYIAQEIIISFGYANILNETFSALGGVISAGNSAVNPYIYLVFQSKNTNVKKCCSNLMNAFRPSQWSMSSHRKDTSFMSVSNSSRVHMNLVNPQSRAGRISSVIDTENRAEETFL